MANKYRYVVWNPNGTIIETDDAFRVLEKPVLGSYCMTQHIDSTDLSYYCTWFVYENNPFPRFNPVDIYKVPALIKTTFLLKGINI